MSRRSQRAKATGPSGVLVVDKPTGMSSFDVIRRLRGLIGPQKFGHAGTLDPLATGVLPILINRTTRLAPYIVGTHKEYVAEVLLGRSTDTDDAEGKTIAESSAEHVDEAMVRDAILSFIGEQQQKPPAYSAIHTKGKRAYELARAGEEVELPSRSVTIEAIELLDMALPTITIRVRCGKGTYIRALARDIGTALGTHGMLTALRRTQVGQFHEDSSVTLERLAQTEESDRWGHLIAPWDVLADVPSLPLDATRAVAVTHGQLGSFDALDDGTYRLTPPGEPRLLALLEVREGKAKARVFLPDYRPEGSAEESDPPGIAGPEKNVILAGSRHDS